MDSGTYSDDEYTPPSSPDDPIYTSFGGGMFAGSQHFTIGGGTFNNNNNTTNHYHPAPVGPPDFRMISMGDIDLQQELTVNEKSGIINRRLGRERRYVRRVYSAKIDGRNTDLTVAMYQGDGAEEAWRRDVETYITLRHPNIVQMYGTASSSAMYATIFHGDLIPFQQFVASASPIITVYIYACYIVEWRQAGNYVVKSPYFRRSSEVDLEIYSTLWIRRSNGRLCADFGPQPDGKNEGSELFFNSFPREYHPPINPSLDSTSQEAAATQSLTLEEYHEICWLTLHQFRSVSVSSSATISSGAVVVLPTNSQLEEGAEIAYLPGARLYGGKWNLGEERLNGVRMENGWTRCNTEDNVCNHTYNVWPGDASAWLTQANYIFSRLQITSNFKDYVLVDGINFEITIGTMREDAPPGYLFLCPTTDFQTGPSSLRWPDCPAYWSLDPSGVDRLSTEEATQLGFPAFQLTIEIEGDSWDTSVYAGLRQFHQAKGFDPDSQDVARHLGYDLYQLSREVNSPFAHVEEDWSDDGTEEGETDDEWGDAQSSVEVEQDGDKSTENFDANVNGGPLNVCTEPPEQNTAEAHQEPAHGVDQHPNPAEHRTLSIRRSNGRLCADFIPQRDGKNQGNASFSNVYLREYHPPINPSLDPTSQEAAVINSLTLGEYHHICVFTLCRVRSGSFSSSAMISSGDVFLCPPNAQPLEGAAIVSISLGAKVFSWDSRLGEEKLNGVLTENHWTRFNAKDVSKHGLTCVVSFDTLHTAWLAQANHIFSRLQITSNLEDYVLVDEVEFRIAIGNTRQDAPPGYLFLCPTTDLQTGLLSFRWPDYPAYWSLDPSGADRLSSEEATQLGFPSFQLTSKFEGLSWDTSVYAGLRQFHQAKGFDPDSQDVARDTGYPLYRLSREVNSLFAHMEEDWSDDGTDEGETDDEWEDAQSSVEVEQDGDKSTENSDANEDEGPLNVCTEPPEQNTAEARQDPAHSVGHAPNPADSHVFRTGIGFIHRIIGGLQRGLVIESENLDTDPISPFLV